ncbi:hypothetical protein M5689_006240 [Euphorbia peplus]|nr:hypothetical protein M5689_006240 [Euphorbia peplus]
MEISYDLRGNPPRRRLKIIYSDDDEKIRDVTPQESSERASSQTRNNHSRSRRIDDNTPKGRIEDISISTRRTEENIPKIATDPIPCSYVRTLDLLLL